MVVLSATVSAVPAAQAGTKYAGIVVDAKTGRTLYADNANDLRYPASLTKMMTLYLTFEALSTGRITKATRIPISEHAAAQPPTKLGLRPGETIDVDDAIKALVTRSANDIAVALGEYLGGTEDQFARLMTAKAHALGMSRTTFRNANGLPAEGQMTTAHDMARLGIALREHFPQYYAYFSTRSFTYAHHRIGNHNHLLGRVRGMDGIKTGYTHASGFNLVSSVRNDGRSIVAVVMGGRTAHARDQQMVALINRYLPRASRSGPGDLIDKAPLVASAIVLPRKDAPTPDLRPSRKAAEPAPLPVTAYAEPRQQPALKAVAAVAPAPSPAPSQGIDQVNTASTTPSGWVIQVASLGSESEARHVLSRTADKAGRILADASPFTQTFEKGGNTYYRARFAGFASKSQAWHACAVLKRKDIACYAVEQ